MPYSRKRFLGAAVTLPLLASAVIARADAGDKVSKGSVNYQTTPNGKMHCSGCKFFTPGADATSDGTCAIVDGTISPNGYCIAYNAKS